jgi:hypothetical protein
MAYTEEQRKHVIGSPAREANRSGECSFPSALEQQRNTWFANLCMLRKMGASRSLRLAYVAGLGYGSRIQRMYMVIPHGPLLSKTKRIHMFVVIDLFSSKGS